MTDYRFELREFFSKTPITDSWSTKINGKTKNSTNGIIEGQITPGVYNIELTNHTNTFPADRIEIGEDVRILFPKFHTDTLTFNNDFTATTYRPSKNNPNFNEQTLPSWLAIYDNEAFGVRVPLEQNQEIYISLGDQLGCENMNQTLLNGWRSILPEFETIFGQYYNLTSAEGTNPPTTIRNGFTQPADNTLVLCQGFPLAGFFPGAQNSSVAGIASSNTHNTGTLRVEGFYYLARGYGEDSENRGYSFFDKNPVVNNLTPFDFRSIELAQAYGRPAGIRRVESGGATPFFSLRQ